LEEGDDILLNVNRSYNQHVRNALFSEDVQSDIVLGIFVNGESMIQNVPYTKRYTQCHTHGTSGDTQGTIASVALNDGKASSQTAQKNTAEYDLYLTHDVLYQLSQIIKSMEKDDIKTVDYQRFIIENSRLVGKDGRGSSSAVCFTSPDVILEDSRIEIQDSSLSNISNMERIVDTQTSSEKTTSHINQAILVTQHASAHDEKQHSKNIATNWLKQYWTMRLQANAIQPVTRNASTVGKTKAEEAKLWLSYFHERLNLLPELERNIIEKKYLESGQNGRPPLDEFVINTLFISQRQYYYRKKEALHLLGLALGDNWHKPM